ncbi:MAG: GNAT family N-acetyltransferase [Shewanella sp.]
MTHIRPVLKSELSAVYELEREIFGEHSYPDFFFRQAFDCWPAHFWVAVDANRGEAKDEAANVTVANTALAVNAAAVHGYLLCAQSGSPECMWILSVAVSAAKRGQGLGRGLLMQCLAQLPPTVRRLYLTVDPNNPAQALYRQLGFVATTLEADYFGAGADRIVMQYQPA